MENLKRRRWWKGMLKSLEKESKKKSVVKARRKDNKLWGKKKRKATCGRIGKERGRDRGERG